MIQKTVFVRKWSSFFFQHFPKYRDFNAKVGRENIFKPTTGNESLQRDSNDNGVRIVNFAKSKNLVVKCTMFPHRKIHKYTCTSPDGKIHNQIHHMVGDGIRVQSLYNLSGELNVIPIPIWWLQKLGKDWQ
jgi:ribosomal protein S17